MPFYVDERAIVPRCFIAELLAEGSLDSWLNETTHKVLDLCTGNGSLAVLAAMAYPDVMVRRPPTSAADALAVARINVERHGLQQRITLLESDGLARARRPLRPDSVQPALCQRPQHGRPARPNTGPSPRWRWPGGGIDGMDFVRRAAARRARAHMTEHAVLVLEIGNERDHFEAAFPTLEVVWLDTSAGDDQVLLITCAKPLRHEHAAALHHAHDHPEKRHPCAAAPRCCSTAPPSPSTPAKKSAWWGATAPANPSCSRCSTARCTRTAATTTFPPSGAWPRWRRTCPRPIRAPPTS